MADSAFMGRPRSMLYFLDCRTDPVPEFVRWQLERYHAAGVRIVVFTFLQASRIQEELKELRESGVISDFVVSKDLRFSFSVVERVFGRGVSDDAVGTGDVYFSTAQCFGPLIPASELFRAREASGAAIWGITLQTGRGGEFVEPYFMSIGRDVLSDSRFLKVLKDV